MNEVPTLLPACDSEEGSAQRQEENNQSERRRAMKKADTNDSSPAPFAPATGSSGPCPICRDPGCMGNECSPPLSEEEDDAMEEWLSELTETCQADLRPCAGCQQGAVCDGPNAGI